MERIDVRYEVALRTVPNLAEMLKTYHFLDGSKNRAEETLVADTIRALCEQHSIRPDELYMYWVTKEGLEWGHK